MTVLTSDKNVLGQKFLLDAKWIFCNAKRVNLL